jgi:uncharacterized protein YdeI (YjbR/CyaY-like superfamily)
MNMSGTFYAANRHEWRQWLEQNHNAAQEVWLIYYKKHTGKPRVPYGEAVEEALCYGWVDSIVKRIDEETYAQKFTPRKDSSQWSESNKKRVEKLIREGRMTEAGLAKIKAARRTGKWEKPVTGRQEFVMPPELIEALSINKEAGENFNKLAPSHRRQYIGWIASAKKEETKKKRVKEAIGLLEQNQKLGMK